MTVGCWVSGIVCRVFGVGCSPGVGRVCYDGWMATNLYITNHLTYGEGPAYTLSVDGVTVSRERRHGRRTVPVYFRSFAAAVAAAPVLADRWTAQFDSTVGEAVGEPVGWSARVDG